MRAEARFPSRMTRRAGAIEAAAFLLAMCAASPGIAQTASPGGSRGAGQQGAVALPQSAANGNAPADRAMSDALPLTPEEIENLAKRFNATRRAEEQSVNETAVPINRQVNISFAPGGATSIINTVRGYPTAVSFFDSTGQPWPVQWDTNSNPAAIAPGPNCNAQTNGGPAAMAVGFFVCAPTKGSNTLEITPVSLVPRGGLVVSLEGAPKPLTFLLVTGGGRYDASLSIHVADRGPHAKVEIMTRPDAPETGAPYLTGMLEGVPPADAVPLDVQGVSPDGIRAWRLGRNVYLRTRYTLLSPEWNASEAEGGTTVYAIPATPVVLLSVDGRTVSALLKDPS